jgi:hypothetical protein
MAGDLRSDQVLVRTLAGGCVVVTSRSSSVPAAVAVEILMFQGSLGFPLHEVVGRFSSRASCLRRGDRVVRWAGRSDGLRSAAILNAEDVVPYPPSMAPEDAVALQRWHVCRPRLAG